MGCVPDRNLSKYCTFQEQANKTKNQFRLQNISRESRISADSNDLNVSYRSFNKNYQSCKKKSINLPVILRSSPIKNRKYFSVDKKQPNIIEQREIDAIKIERSISGRKQRTKGTIKTIPYRQHVIAEVETPSQSIKTSFLSNIQKHPSILFVKDQEGDLDLIFRSLPIEKYDQSTNQIIYTSVDAGPLNNHSNEI